ncbi:MAG: methyltransferase domain-containing protein [Cyanobacteria bacterium REEB67]|nr:methyltransferase domain-containing protein [Cyanobacteria bacterium REEB67]
MAFKTPLQFVASLTADFAEGAAGLRHNSARHTTNWLDIGCGDGLVAAALATYGCQVTAIDGSEKSIAEARANGVNATLIKMQDFEHEPFDIILISRALHHMPPLAETLQKVQKLLKPEGTLIIEDFAREVVDERAASWLFQRAEHYISAEAKQNPSAQAQDEHSHKDPDCKAGRDRHAWLRERPASDHDAKRLWHEHFVSDHHLATGSEMQFALESFFQVKSFSKMPSLFRHICDFLPATADGADTAAQIWAEEMALIERESIPAVGFRVVLAARSGL